MKKSVTISILFLMILSCFCSYAETIDGIIPTEYDQGFSHPYGMVAHKNMILVSNFGTETLNDEVKEGKGFISAIQGGVVKTFIRSDGHLIAPKGMAIYDNLLFVADLGKLVVYNLKKIINPPVEILFPPEEITLTDVKVVGEMLIVSVNNTGHIYGIDLRRTTVISQAKTILLAELPGAGMMSVSGTKLLVNSFKSEISDSSVLYVADLTSDSDNPFKPLIADMPSGQYLGLSISETGNVYFSALKTSDISHPMLYSYNLDGKESIRFVDTGFRLVSPTSLLLIGNSLWIIDYVQSRAYRFEIK